MDIENLIADLQKISQMNSISHYKRGVCAAASTALSTLQAENEKLHDLWSDASIRLEDELAENEKLRSDLRRLQTERDTLLAANQSLLAEREQLTTERDAAITDLRKWSICITCIHYNPHGKKSNCKVKEAYLPGGNWAGCSKWKWRGIKED